MNIVNIVLLPVKKNWYYREKYNKEISVYFVSKKVQFKSVYEINHLEASLIEANYPCLQFLRCSHYNGIKNTQIKWKLKKK